MFKTRRLYLRIFVNRMELTNLETGESVQAMADPPFSGRRQALGDFFAAEAVLRQLIRDLGLKTGLFRPGIEIVMHQLELSEGGLSQLELRGLRDLGNMVGARIVHIVDREHELRTKEALAAFSKPTARR